MKIYLYIRMKHICKTTRFIVSWNKFLMTILKSTLPAGPEPKFPGLPLSASDSRLPHSQGSHPSTSVCGSRSSPHWRARWWGLCWLCTYSTGLHIGSVPGQRGIHQLLMPHWQGSTMVGCEPSRERNGMQISYLILKHKQWNMNQFSSMILLMTQKNIICQTNHVNTCCMSRVNNAMFRAVNYKPWSCVRVTKVCSRQAEVSHRFKLWLWSNLISYYSYWFLEPWTTYSKMFHAMSKSTNWSPNKLTNIW